MRCFSFLVLLTHFILNGLCSRVQHSLETTNVVSGSSVAFQCSVPAQNTILEWRFLQNGSDAQPIQAAQFFQGIVSIHGQFSQPPGRSSLHQGVFNITDIGVQDEGDYWCEIREVGEVAKTSDKYPLHVWVRPKPPEVIPLGADPNLVQEYTSTTVAKCKSTGGKPAAKLSWWNGTALVPNVRKPVVTKNPFDNHLWDITLDLVILNWTRFDHRRNFTCLIEHPAYGGVSIRLNRSVNVQYHPINARIWANTTTNEVFCHADAYPAPVYFWVLPGGSTENNTAMLLMSNLLSLPENQYFHCTADNGIPHPAQVRVLVEDLLYPNGKPPALILGLPLYIWIAIGAGVVVFIVVVIIICCCCCRKKKEKDDVYKPKMKQSDNRHSQPSLLELDSMRTPDGRESSLPPSDFRATKAEMARAYSLENIADRKYGGDPRDSVALIPLKDRYARDDLYNDSSLNRRASREEIDKIADHIEVLNKSWDNLAQSREHLTRSREELRVDLPPPRYGSRDDLNSRNRVAEHDSYPYMDDTVDSRASNPPARSFSNRDYYEHEIIDQKPSYYHDPNPPRDDYRYNDDKYRDDESYRNNYRGNQPYDDGYRSNHARGDGYQRDQYHDDRYQGNQSYDDGYQGNRGYNDGYQGNRSYGNDYGASDGHQDYQRSDFDNRQPSYGDSEFDDDNQREGYGYQPASMI